MVREEQARDFHNPRARRLWKSNTCNIAVAATIQSVALFVRVPAHLIDPRTAARELVLTRQAALTARVGVEGAFWRVRILDAEDVVEDRGGEVMGNFHKAGCGMHGSATTCRSIRIGARRNPAGYASRFQPSGSLPVVDSRFSGDDYLTSWTC